MLSKKNRLTKKQFSEIFPLSRVMRRGSFLLIKKREDPYFKAGVVVSKKIAKKAVERNSFKRKIYALLQEYQKTLKIKGFFIILFQKKPDSLEDIQTEMDTLFKNAHD